ncbi:MAG: allantoicase [Pseudomonadota bacterium]
MSGKDPFKSWIALEQPRLGTRVVYANDEFFAAKERLIEPAAPVFIADKYDDHGKWMDGWESRRKRGPGHDYCVVRLGVPGRLRGVDIDTSHFTGNYPPEASLEACFSPDEVPEADWVEVLPKTSLEGDRHHWHAIEHYPVVTHVRLNIYPDGGVARLRLYGEVIPEFDDPADIVDLFALRNGGRALAASDEHFGSMHNLNLPGRGVNMGDGWETARRRGPGNDWVVLALGARGTVRRAEIDTAHFKGNYPDSASIEAALFGPGETIEHDSERWEPLLPRVKLAMDQQHYFEDELLDTGPISHARLSIYPDGGVSRLRLFGTVAGEDDAG